MEAKKERVRDMFNSIAEKYDLLNHTLSFTFDKRWRKRMIKSVVDSKAQKVLDVATGTGDMALGLVGAGVQWVRGVDLSPGMVEVGRRKVEARGVGEQITLEVQDVECLSFANESFDAVTCAFGVRNFENLEIGLAQMHRVLKTGSGCYILEFSKVNKGLWGSLYGFYFHKILPFIGRVVSGDKGAYSYLPTSVDEFASGEAFLATLRKVGFSRCEKKELMGGIATIYTAKR